MAKYVIIFNNGKTVHMHVMPIYDPEDGITIIGMHNPLDEIAKWDDPNFPVNDITSCEEVEEFPE